jgi:hypothetical protein
MGGGLALDLMAHLTDIALHSDDFTEYGDVRIVAS